MKTKTKTKKRKDVSGILYQFKIFTAPRTHLEHFRVIVYRDQAALDKSKSDCKPELRDPGRVCAAYFKPTSIERVIQIDANGDERARRDNYLGRLCFMPESLTVGIIAHEVSHAVVFWCKLYGVDPIGPETTDKETLIHSHCDDERFSELIGSLVAQTLVSFTKTKSSFNSWTVAGESSYY